MRGAPTAQRDQGVSRYFQISPFTTEAHLEAEKHRQNSAALVQGPEEWSVTAEEATPEGKATWRAQQVSPPVEGLERDLGSRTKGIRPSSHKGPRVHTKPAL